MKRKGAKVGRSFSPNLFGVHRYTTVGGMCALRGVLQTAVACVPQSKGEMTFPLRCREWIGCMHKRNRHLVDYSTVCVAYLASEKGGGMAAGEIAGFQVLDSGWDIWIKNSGVGKQSSGTVSVENKLPSILF